MQHFIYMMCILFSFSRSSFGASKITSIDFNGTGDSSELSIRSDVPITYEKQENTQDNQVIIEIKDATISKSLARKIDTSSFKGKVSLVSPYQVEDQANIVRVVMQLREPGTATLNQDGNLLKVSIPNSDTPPQPTAEAAPPPPSSAPEANANSNPPSSATDLSSSSSTTAPQDKAKLDDFIDNKSTQKFTGKPVTLQVRDADVADVLRLIGDASGFNIIIGDDVKGKITLSLTDVPWDQALDVILHTLHLGAERNNSILRVVTLQSLTAEKQEELKAIRAAEASAPRVTRVFPVNYANLSDLQSTLVKFTSNDNSNLASNKENASPAAIVQLDNRTNSLIVRDLPENIERIKKLIEILDVQTPQVIIEAKVIEATESFAKSLSGNLGIGSSGANPFVASAAGGNPIDPLLGTPGVFATGADVGSLSSPKVGPANGTFGISPALSFIPGLSRLNALLSWGESESQVKVISSPKTVVMNKEKASILQGTPVLVPGTTTVAGVGLVQTKAVQSANLSLHVKPTVTNDSSVLMDLTVTKDVPYSLVSGDQGIAARNITTLVLVESGTTLVIGGIYTMTTTHVSQGIPFLRKIPILGALFGSDSESTERSELFVFITPRILNPKEAGLGSNG